MRSRRRQAQRSGKRGLHGPASHVLRDDGQLLVRRLLQGGRHRVCVDVVDARVRIATGQAVRHRLPYRRRGVRPVEAHRGPAGQPNHPHSHLGQFLVGGGYRPLRPMFRVVLRPGPLDRRRPAWYARRGWRPLPRVLEPGLHAVRSGRRQSHAPTQAFDRHGHGPGAHQRDSARQDQQLCHFTASRPHRGGREPNRHRSGWTAGSLAPRDRRSSAGKLVLAGRRRDCLPTRAAAMCCAGSCAAPCATRIFWARAIRCS